MRTENSSITPAPDPGEFDRNAFNAAFSELGLCWHWDEKTYAELQAIAAEGERLRQYLETQQRHLLKAYDADFLIDAIRETKMRVCGDLTGAQRTQ